LASVDIPLQKKVEFNINKELNNIYSQLLDFVSRSKGGELRFDLHMLYYALGKRWNNHVVIYSRIIHDIIDWEVSRWNRSREIPGKIDEILEPKTYSDSELKELTKWYATREDNHLRVNKRWAAFLIHYIDQVASDAWYQWIDGKWKKYKTEQRFAEAKKKIKKH
jgi:hypothetical protein